MEGGGWGRVLQEIPALMFLFMFDKISLNAEEDFWVLRNR